MDSLEEPTPEKIQHYSNEFDAMCQERHAMGAKKYGEGTWQDNDLARMMQEEIVDLANYARYAFIKVALLAEVGNLNPPSTFVSEGEIKPTLGYAAFLPGNKTEGE